MTNLDQLPEEERSPDVVFETRDGLRCYMKTSLTLYANGQYRPWIDRPTSSRPGQAVLREGAEKPAAVRRYLFVGTCGAIGNIVAVYREEDPV